MEEVYKALGWQGGTIHQVITEIKRLKNESEVRRQALKLANEQIDYMKPSLSEYAGKVLELEREVTILKADLANREIITSLAQEDPAVLRNLIDSARADKECYAELCGLVAEIAELCDVVWLGNPSTHAVREAIKEIYRHSAIADREMTNLRNQVNAQAEELQELRARIRHATQTLEAEFTPPQIDEIRKVRGLEPLSTAQKVGEHGHNQADPHT